MANPHTLEQLIIAHFDGKQLHLETISVQESGAVLSGAWSFDQENTDIYTNLLKSRLVFPVDEVSSKFLEKIPSLVLPKFENLILEGKENATHIIETFISYVEADKKRKTLVQPRLSTWPEPFNLENAGEHLIELAGQQLPTNTPFEFKPTLAAAMVVKKYVDAWISNESERISRSYLDIEPNFVRLLPEAWGAVMVNRFAVIDLETTGVGNLDTILEIGIVLVDGNEIVLEWESLVNPDRDVANDSIHGVTPGMFSTAPVFEEIQNDIARLLDGRILVAHNLPFDRRMLNQQLARGYDNFELGNGFCTKATKLSLHDACQHYGINNSQSHRAITDARVAAMLLNATFRDDHSFSPVQIEFDDSLPMARTLARGAFNESERSSSSKIRRIARSTSMPQISEAEMSYLDALSSGLSDLHLTEMEISHLEEWADFLGSTDEQRQKAHQSYFDSFLVAAERDGIITEEEKLMIDRLGILLEVKHDRIIATPQSDSSVLHSGVRVCFTGSAKDESGKDLLRSDLENYAREKGLVSVDTVSKGGCDVLVAADKNSMSGKAKKAKGWGMPSFRFKSSYTG